MLTIGTFFKDRRGSAPQFTAAHTGPKDRRCSPHTNHANTQNMANMVTNIRCFRSSPAKGGQVTGLPRVDVPYESCFPRLQFSLQVDVPGAKRLTPLQWAAHKGHAAIAERLLAAGADTRRRGGTLDSPALLFAANAEAVCGEAATARGAKDVVEDRNRDTHKSR